ncbi:iron-containing alcohol dehydrogenase family protein [Sporolactobacillus spathodeae]|uniref:iron-containing alcohol dehydrogenase family protein n=1 Tax=Sporolactobacillus spathodeae TaxID=1465502 RepID=UPI0019601061|nr:iron-containing alcohol dehydrogenase family protein [Sporolactobacillus spathodeae]
MVLPLVSRIAPQQYLSEEGAYDFLSEAIEKLFLKKIIFLHGEKSLHAALPYLPDLQALPAEIVDFPFSGECSEAEIKKLIQTIRATGADALIGLGGGKVLDTAKAAAYHAGNLPLILLPTLASNCAAWSALSVIYAENGTSLGHRIYPKQANLVLIEPRVIAASPVRFFVAGIADTLAKWYETERLLRAAGDSSLAVIYARQSARLCRDIPLQHAQQAVRAMRDQKVTDDWKLVMETTIMAGGLVGGFADELGRATAAHSVHDALTTFSETKHLLHGEKVAYGIILQLALEKNQDEIEKLRPFYRSLQLPFSLADLNLADLPEDGIRELAAQTVTPDKTIHLLPYSVTEEKVVEAIQSLENLAVRQ